MSINTRIPQGVRGAELFDYGGLQILGPVELEVTVENWGDGQDPDAVDLGIPDGMTVRVVFKCVPFPVDDDAVDDDDDTAVPIGRYFANEVHIETTTAVVTATVLNRISLPKILRAAVGRVRKEFSVSTVDPDTGDYMARSFREPSELGIAGAWAYGRLVGEDPTKYVQTAFGLKSRQAAAQRVSRARNADPPQLPPTRQGAH